MGLLDYYRQFEGMSEEEVNQGLREEAAERRRKALTRVETLDLSLTTWPGLPHPRIVSAITFVARRGLHRYPHLAGADLRGTLAERHGVEPDRLILGNGAAELLSAATRALIEPGQQLLTLWPSYPLYPIMARRAHGQAVRVDAQGAGATVDALLEAAAREPDVRAVALASPNDPTGELIPASELQRLVVGLPEGVVGAAGRVARRVRRRAAHELLAGPARAPAAPARISQLLQGMGPRRAAHRLRDRRPRLGRAARRTPTRPGRL